MERLIISDKYDGTARIWHSYPAGRWVFFYIRMSGIQNSLVLRQVVLMVTLYNIVLGINECFGSYSSRFFQVVTLYVRAISYLQAASGESYLNGMWHLQPVLDQYYTVATAATAINVRKSILDKWARR